jgi:hypothetical protein
MMYDPYLSFADTKIKPPLSPAEGVSFGVIRL